MTEQSLAVREATSLVNRGFDDEQLALLKRTLSDLKPPITTDELTLYKQVIQYTGLNPFNREIYALRIDGRLTIWTGIDGHRRIAQASPRFRGLAGPEWCGTDGVWRDVWLEDHAPAACRVGVYLPGRQEPTWGIAYYKNYKNRVSATWKSQPEQMLAVRAESFALRKCFSRELAGVALPDDDRPGYVDSDGVIDEARQQRALEPGQRSARMQAVVAEMDQAVADGAATDVVDPEQVEGWEAVDEHEREQAPAPGTGELAGPRWASLPIGRSVSAMADMLLNLPEGDTRRRFVLPANAATDDEVREWLASKKRLFEAARAQR